MSKASGPQMRSEIASLNPYVPGTHVQGGIKLSSNENPRGASPKALAAIAAASQHLNRYPDGGITDLSEALAAKWGVTPDMLVVGHGSDEILVMLAGAFIRPGDNVITGAHTFSQYEFASTIFGAEVRRSPMPDGRFDLEDIMTRIDGSTRIVFLCSPNNPTGSIVPEADLVSFAESVPESVVIAVDEAYAEFASDARFPDTIELLSRFPNLVRLRTFSKIYGLAALRVGYATAQPALAGAIDRLRQPFNVGTIAQDAALAALADEEFVTQSIEENERGRAKLQRFLADRGIPFIESEANYVCADFAGVSGGASQVRDRLREDGITVRPLASFGLPDHLRISVGTEQEMDQFYASMARL